MTYGIIPPMWPMPDRPTTADFGDIPLGDIPLGDKLIRNPGLGDLQSKMHRADPPISNPGLGNFQSNIPPADPPLYLDAPYESSISSKPIKAAPPVRNDIAYSSGGTFNGRSLQNDIHRQLRNSKNF